MTIRNTTEAVDYLLLLAVNKLNQIGLHSITAENIWGYAPGKLILKKRLVELQTKLPASPLNAENKNVITYYKNAIKILLKRIEN